MVKVEIDGMICEKIEEVEETPSEEKHPELKTCEKDPRFQQMNQTKWCYHMFVDFHRCKHYFGGSHKFCTYFENCYKSICPKSWIETWQSDMEKGAFPRDTTKDMGF
ncbi:hypothetical protein GE061_015115 [Apolygus lucorum]|uniref:Uncharacterized protein n=1 Tax=Apolygus lucorum TaxID=248454 RepID=A0A6A4J107_APOLU|nr:hypothetical protein GE061_015115 [Apolygus lucorum]